MIGYYLKTSRKIDIRYGRICNLLDLTNVYVFIARQLIFGAILPGNLGRLVVKSKDGYQAINPVGVNICPTIFRLRESITKSTIMLVSFQF